MKILGEIGKYTIIDRETSYKTFVVAYGFDRKSMSWAQGFYFNTFESACKFCINRRMIFMSYDRLEEIATNALGYLRYDLDENLLDEFCENYDIDLDESELEYFGLPSRL